ncbi:putative serine esterase-domain-containing protein [Scheffersomyces coipomensis]|uniref:putative serine esterase-domain-containing protein n=1 Tax=Scheffersomyces coipomensis TaxID=1788519 RepID=UPI00315C70B3
MAQSDSDSNDDKILYREVRSLKAGQIQRFNLHYTPEPSESIHLTSNLWLKVKNIEPIPLRAAFLAGPYVLYVDCKRSDYDPNQACFITADQPVFEPSLLPGQAFYAQLSCHTIKDSYSWTVDVISQIIFNNTIDVDFEILIGTSKKVLHEASIPEKKVLNADQQGSFISSTILNVSNQDTLDLWNLPVPDPNKPIHLVILTHGLHSNVSADMFYLKEQIDSVKGENIVVKGYFGNVAKTERGVKYLGSRVAEYIVDLVTNNESLNNDRVSKISFIGHSLGGLVQTVAIAYIQVNYPWFFKQIKPINFITIASPMLGIVNENPVYVKLALSAGLVGKTGRDVSLKYLENDSKPLLLLLPTGPTHHVLKRFIRRTAYANSVNDGIVPLRTSSLLFLDYKELIQIINSPENKLKTTQSTSTGIVPPIPAINGDSFVFSPVQTFLSYFMPQKQAGHYQKFQTNDKSNVEEENSLMYSADDSYEELPTQSVLETATSLILPPLPSLKFINDPSSREPVIVIDKVYREEDLPPHTPAEVPCLNFDTTKTDESPSISIRQRILNTIDYDVEHLEEDIAREYHKNMDWRKVIVKLKPDAHNNIIVRRRFANAYGWPVIEHLVSNHFGAHNALEEDFRPSNSIFKDSLDSALDLTRIISRDLVTKQNKEIDQQSIHESTENHWINSKDNAESLFAVGPTGLLSEVSEMVGNLRDQFYNGFKVGVPGVNTNGNQDQKPIVTLEDEMNDSEIVTDYDDGNGLARRIMGGFL